jgi:hypothetical protein
MALALNIFKTVTKVATTNEVGIYTAPVGYTGFVLLAQASNIGNNTQRISLSHKRTKAGIAVTTEIVNQFPISPNDSATLLGGKLVLESGDVIVLSASNSTDIKFLGSILETLN